MITSVEIENLRGIRTGRLDGLAPLTILTGPNACGKSTILDAFLIAASPDPAEGVGRAVSRHPSVSNGARWLVRGGGQNGLVKLRSAEGVARQCELRWSDQLPAAVRSALTRSGVVPPYSSISGVLSGFHAERPAVGPVGFEILFGDENRFQLEQSASAIYRLFPVIVLVDPGLGRPQKLEETFTEMARAGGREAVYDLLTQLVPGFERLEILAFGGNEFGLVVTSNGRSVPLGLSGDGIQAFVQLALEIAAVPGGLVLVEEPEVYQHPRAIRQTARAILANVRRGVQMVVTTHSLELIDALLAEASDEDLERMALFNLALENGELNSGRRAGNDMRFARETLEKDLR